MYKLFLEFLESKLRKTSKFDRNYSSILSDKRQIEAIIGKNEDQPSSIDSFKISTIQNKYSDFKEKAQVLNHVNI